MSSERRCVVRGTESGGAHLRDSAYAANLLIAAFAILVLVDLWAVSQTLMLVGFATVFGTLGHVAIWIPAVVIALALTAGLVWLTVIVWKAMRATFVSETAHTSRT